MIRQFWKFLGKHDRGEHKFENLLTKDESDFELQDLLKMNLIFPYELAKSLLICYLNESENVLQTNHYTIFPNISYDFYPIKPNNYSAAHFKLLVESSKEQEESPESTSNLFRTGFLKLNAKGVIVPIDLTEVGTNSNIIGLWISDIPSSKEFAEFKKNPFVWAACARFVLVKDMFTKVFSPSSDKNTFLVVHFNSDDLESSLEFREFKVVQNVPSQSKPKAHNSWVIIDSQKTLDLDENFQVGDLLKKPTILRKPVDKSEKCNVYTLSKYLSKYEFGNGKVGEGQRKGSSSRGGDR